jgi:hypothetical protein
MEKAKIFVDYWFLANCPHCGYMIDFASDDYDLSGEFSVPIFTNQWDKLKGRIANCSNCGKDFKIEGVEK